MSVALLIIDFQEEWASANPEVSERIRQAVDELRDDMPVIWVYTNFLGDIGKPQNVARDGLGGSFRNAAESLYKPAAVPMGEDWVVGKDANSAFTNPYLAAFLKRRGIDKLYIAGYRATDCIYDSCIQGVDDFEIIVLSDLTADEYDAALDETEWGDFEDAGIEVSDTAAYGLSLE